MHTYRIKSFMAVVLTLAVVISWSLPASAQIVTLDSFNPTEVGSLCGIGFDAGVIWVHDCSGASIHSYATDGTFLASIPRQGESANDVDLDIAPETLTLGTTTVPAGAVLFINGESGPAEIYALDKDTGDLIATLETSFGVSHVVGGAYHPLRDTFFLVQDLVPGVDDENRIAEIDPATGAVMNTFQITATFSVNYGDIEVSNSTGNLFVVSSNESGIGEFTPTGDFVQVHALPSGVTSLSGIALDCATHEAWVSGTGGDVWRLGSVPCTSYMSAGLECTPGSGTVPFSTQLTVTMENLYTAQTRRVSAHIDVTVAAGNNYPNWRAGFTNIAAGGVYTTMFPVTIPALGSVIGDNHFVLVAEDVTPPPFNQPPYPPAGGTDTDMCTVTAAAP